MKVSTLMGSQDDGARSFARDVLVAVAAALVAGWLLKTLKL